MSKVLMRSSLQALYLKVSSKLALQTQIWNPDYFHNINDKSMIPRSSSINEYCSFWIIEFLLISWRNNDFKVFSCESRRWVFVSNFKNQACTIILLYYIFSFLSLFAHQKNYLTLFFPINFVLKKITQIKRKVRLHLQRTNFKITRICLPLTGVPVAELKAAITMENASKNGSTPFVNVIWPLLLGLLVLMVKEQRFLRPINFTYKNFRSHIWIAWHFC